MFTIEVYFVNQPDGGIDPLETFTCEDKDLPSTLDSVRKYINEVLENAAVRMSKYYKAREATCEPCVMHSIDKVIVNGNEFYDLPNLMQIAQMTGYNPLVGAKFKEILYRYPEISKVGFDGHDMNTKGVSGSITLMYDDADFYKMYAAVDEVESLYSVDGVDTLVVLAKSTKLSGFYYTYVKGVDF